MTCVGFFVYGFYFLSEVLFNYALPEVVVRISIAWGLILIVEWHMI